MTLHPRVVFPAVALLTVWAANGLTLAAGQADAPRVSIWEGVYTTAQATHGQEVYVAACSGCHGKDLKGIRDNRALVGDRFWQDWGEDSLGTLFEVVQRTMPRNKAGSLPAQDYLDIIAYVLQQNGYPAGSRELSATTVGPVWVMRKEGPGPVPNFSLVWVVGCLAKEADGSWALTRVTEPVKTRNPAPSGGADLQRVNSTALAAETFGLMDVAADHAAFNGKKVEAKGLLMRGPRTKLNLTSMQALAGDCPQ
jgi:mono/diheme cytochrome c family protein